MKYSEIPMTRTTSALRCTRCRVILTDGEAWFCFLDRCYGQAYCLECRDVHERREAEPQTSTGRAAQPRCARPSQRSLEAE